MRYLLISLLLFSMGCTCTQTKPFMKFHQAITKKLVNYVMANNEASKYEDEKEDSLALLRGFTALGDVFKISAKIRLDGFTWHKENVDFVSFPWVTVARKRGDCDDFMALWENVLESLGVTKKVSVRSTAGGGHAMLLFNPKESKTWYILSNTRVLGADSQGDTHRLIRLFYGKDKTACFIIY